MFERAEAQKPIRIPSLDGWRGIAILLVLFDHFLPYREGAVNPRLLFVGQHGVALFFVLSGFLITTGLLNETDRDGRANIPGFYLRRAFRILPAAWCYLLLLGLLIPQVTHRELASSFLFFRNYAPFSPFTAHFWSLSIEEQFYLVWPALLLLLSRRQAFGIAIFGAAAIAFYRMMHWDHFNSLDFSLTLRTELRADALFVGCAMAIALRNQRFRACISRIWLTPLLIAVVLCLYSYHRFIPLHESIVFAALLAATSIRPTPALDWAPLRYLGRLSYSLYIWQQPLMEFHAHTWNYLELRLALLVVLALASHYWIEEPLRRAGRHISELVNQRSPVPIAAMSQDLAEEITN